MATQSQNTFIISFGAWHKHQENVGTTLAEAAYENKAYDHNLHLTDVTAISPKLMHEGCLGIEFDGEDQTPNSINPQLQIVGAFTSGGSTSGALRTSKSTRSTMMTPSSASRNISSSSVRSLNFSASGSDTLPISTHLALRWRNSPRPRRQQ